MITPTTTRRAALAGSAALPALALAMPAAAALPAPASEDPAVVAYRVWLKAWRADRAAYDRPEGYDDDNPELRRIADAQWDARKALAETIATTPAGIACQLRLAFATFNDYCPNDGPDHPESYDIEG